MALLTGGVSDIIFSRMSDRVLGVFGKHSRKKVLEGHSWSSDTLAAQARRTDRIQVQEENWSHTVVL